MEKKEESTTSCPLGMCEKLFRAFNPAFRPLRRLSFHHQEPGGTTNPSPTRPNHSLNSGTIDPGPPKAPPTSEKKLAEAIAPKAEAHHPLPTPAAAPPPSSTSVPVVRKVSDKVVPSPAPPKAAPIPAPPKAAPIPAPPKAAPSPAPPKAATIPQPVPPRAVATPQPLPQPAPPAGAAAATARPKKNINESVEDYIKRFKDKMRTGSGIGRPPTSQ